MHVEPPCVACVFDDLEGAIRLLVDSEDTANQIMQQALHFVARDYALGKVPSYYITGVHRIFKQVTGIAMPFATLRRRANEVGLRITERLVLPADPQERFRYLAGWAIAGNHLDFRTVGTGYELTIEQIYAILENQVQQGLQVDETSAILELVKHARRILYILDNVGEIAFDKLLIQELQQYAPVVSTIRGGPITSDAVMEDAVQVGLDRVAPLVVAGPDTLGISLDEMSQELREEMASADLIIAKGQANYYVMDDYRHQAEQRIACLFSTKCDPVSGNFGLRGKANIAALLR